MPSSLYSNNDRSISVFVWHSSEWRSIAAQKLRPVAVVIVKSLCEHYISVLHDKIRCHLVIFITVTYCTRSNSVSRIQLPLWNVICLPHVVQIMTFIDHSFKVFKNIYSFCIIRDRDALINKFFKFYCCRVLWCFVANLHRCWGNMW